MWCGFAWLATDLNTEKIDYRKGRNMSFEMDGTIRLIEDTQTFDSGFCKRPFIIETNEKYPQLIKLELFKGATDIIDAYQIGQHVVVSFNIRGSAYKGNHYVNLQAWRLKPVGNQEAGVLVDTAETLGINDDDDLPF